ncbi:MAG: hypothetical protein LBR78_00605 [Holosporales bacterium]|jgi:hypothetical protein|nr:hypothetical protein [Holosporales bacterium]
MKIIRRSRALRILLVAAASVVPIRGADAAGQRAPTEDQAKAIVAACEGIWDLEERVYDNEQAAIAGTLARIEERMEEGSGPRPDDTSGNERNRPRTNLAEIIRESHEQIEQRARRAVAQIYPEANAWEIREMAGAITGPGRIIYTFLTDNITQEVPTPDPERDNAEEEERSDITDQQLENVERRMQLMNEHIVQYEIGEELTFQLLELAHYEREIRRVEDSVIACMEDPRITDEVKRRIRKIITRVEYTQQMIRALLYWEAISYEEAG